MLTGDWAGDGGGGAQLLAWRSRDLHVLEFVQESTLVAVGLPIAVQAQDFATIADHINPVSLNHGSGADAAMPLVKVIRRLDALRVPRARQLPDQLFGDTGMTQHCGGVIGHNSGTQYVAVSNWNHARNPHVDAILGRALNDAVAKLG